MFHAGQKQLPQQNNKKALRTTAVTAELSSL